MTYSGASTVGTARETLGQALEALQADPAIPSDVMEVASNIAGAVGALFEAEGATSEIDGKGCVKKALQSLSQTLALLQDVKAEHKGIEVASETIASAMSALFPLTTVPTRYPPSMSGQPGDGMPAVSNPPVVSQRPQEGSTTVSAKPASVKPSGERYPVEANIGANTETNFFVGFSGEIGQGGVFVATYNMVPKGSPVDLTLTLPGGFEMNIKGVVMFVRDPMDFTTDSEPGFGVKFDSVSDEHRKLMLRFIQKRPPIFYDE